MGLILPMSIIVSLSYPFDTKNSVVYYRCLGEYEKIYDFDSGHEKKFNSCESRGLVCLIAKTAYFVMASNVLEIFLLGFAFWKIMKQSESISYMLSANTAQNRRR